MGEVALRRIQAALEVTRGTDLAATRKVYATGMMTKAIDLIRPNEDHGTFVRNYRSALGVVRSTFPVEGSLTFEDLPWWLQLALKGGVTGAVSAVTVYTYTFVPSLSTDDLKSATFEWGDDTQAFEMHYAMVDKITITGAVNGYWSFKVDLIGNDMTTTTFTGSLPERAVEDINMYLTKCAIGAAGAVPSSYMTSRFIGFELEIDNGLAAKYFADGAAPTLGGMGRAKRGITLKVTMEGNAATITERATYEAGTSRVVRITGTGTVIAGSTGSVVKSADIIVPGKWSDFVVGVRDTNTIFTATLQSEYDTVLAYDISVAIANALVTLP